MRLRLGTGASGLVLRHFGGDDTVPTDLFNSRGTVTLDATRNPNIASISTPVFSANGLFCGALTVSGPNARFDSATRQAAIPELEMAAQELSGQMP